MFALARMPGTPPALHDLVAARRELDAMEAHWLAMVRAYDRSEAWRADGYLSAAAAVRHGCRLEHGVAAGHVTVARRLEDLPVTAAAFEAGEISRRHVDVVVRAYTPQRAAELRDVEAAVVDVARERNPRELGWALRRVTDAIDGDGGARNDEAEHQRRYLHLSRILDGVSVIDGRCAGEQHATIDTALKVRMDDEFSASDSRSYSQRRIDALAGICRFYLDHRSTKRGTAPTRRPHLNVVVDLADLEQRGGTDLAALVRAETRDGNGLSPATLERIACDCEISRVITDGPSKVLDVGRSVRTVPPAIWDALVVRDRHCQAPGCDQPPEHCEAHHIKPFAHGGRTALDNLKLYCSQHHHNEHQDNPHFHRRE
jgi:hypothetical protein